MKRLASYFVHFSKEKRIEQSSRYTRRSVAKCLSTTAGVATQGVQRLCVVTDSLTLHNFYYLCKA